MSNGAQAVVFMAKGFSFLAVFAVITGLTMHYWRSVWVALQRYILSERAEAAHRNMLAKQDASLEYIKLLSDQEAEIRYLNHLMSSQDVTDSMWSADLQDGLKRKMQQVKSEQAMARFDLSMLAAEAQVFREKHGELLARSKAL